MFAINFEEQVRCEARASERAMVFTALRERRRSLWARRAFSTLVWLCGGAQ